MVGAIDTKYRKKGDTMESNIIDVEATPVETVQQPQPVPQVSGVSVIEYLSNISYVLTGMVTNINEQVTRLIATGKQQENANGKDTTTSNGN
jgi:hypothetical protein